MNYELRVKNERRYISPFVSIIVIDYKNDNPYLVECLNAIGKQSYKNFEIVLLTDYFNKLKYPKLRKKSYGRYAGPAEKRDDGAKMAKGEILAFIDDDAFPDKNWLKNMVKNFSDEIIVGVGGPGVTPIGVGWQEESSGWVSASPLGAGSYGYRFLPGEKRFGDDYPSMNLAVRREDFMKVGGFDSHYWPGEDTKLCLDLVYKLKKKIIYDPKVLVYHHRRPLWIQHLRQNGNFGLHRGNFARVLPKTSLKPVYFGPSLMVLGLLYLFVSSFLFFLFTSGESFLFTNFNGMPPPRWYSAVVLIRDLGWLLFGGYLLALILNGVWVFIKSKSWLQGLIVIPAVFVTHLWYGIRFLQGFLLVKKLVR